MKLWDWAVQAYGRPGVEDALLELQDMHGQTPPLLLWAAWCAIEGRPLDGPRLRQAAELAEAWERAAVAPLRQARRALKVPRPPVSDLAREGLRGRVKAAEIEAERVVFDTLEHLSTPPAADRPGVAGALEAAASAASRNAPPKLLRQLAEALAQAPAFRSSRDLTASEDEATPLDELTDEDAIRARLKALRTEHQDLDSAVAALAATSLPDMIQIGRLKKKKLVLRDQISALEERLNPDIIA
ncbi:MAG TPA: TIGR02444 family protein [Caulobacteraceae bacterium]|jgi:uncharacterized protein (TIGR02444 family)